MDPTFVLSVLLVDGFEDTFMVHAVRFFVSVISSSYGVTPVDDLKLCSGESVLLSSKLIRGPYATQS